MDLTKEAIDKIESLVNNARTVEVNGTTYSSCDLRPVRDEPDVRTLEMSTLTSLIDYIKDNFDDLEKSNLAILVESPTHVSLISSLWGKSRNRDRYVSVNLERSRFPFGRWLSQEEFAIEFRTKMQAKEGDDSDYVLGMIGNIRADSEALAQDDGISQEVTVRKGVSGHLAGKEKVKPIVKLSPFRTFNEIEQPQSEFLLRLRHDEDGMKAALFEAGGEAWKLDAVIMTKEFLTLNCPGISVFA